MKSVNDKQVNVELLPEKVNVIPNDIIRGNNEIVFLHLVLQPA